MNEKLVLKSINELLSERFFIPSYQRGYRWKGDQVRNLLDDIWNFRMANRRNSNKDNANAFYCLQPIVVSKRYNDEQGEYEWELIDGQQRLTTISIILQCLKIQLLSFEKTKYSIRYETRPGSEAFLNEISDENLSRRNENVDYYHFCEAYDTVIEWFSAKDSTAKRNFLATLLNVDEEECNVRVIWYDVTEENKSNNYAIDIFTRLNIGKISLTNAELVKALFLVKDNFNQQASLKQIQIATEWDIIEKKLQDDSFWYFIYNPKNTIKYESRIEYILDLLQRKTKEHEDDYTFKTFAAQFEANKKEEGVLNIDKLWLNIKQYFLTIEEWYSNNDLYHLIGYLIENGADINELKENSVGVTKSQFIEYLDAEIRKGFKGVDVDDLDFNSNKKLIRKLLLLFNIQTIRSSQKAEMRFPFNKFKSDKWDIEHINSQTEKKPKDINAWKGWALDLLEYFTGTKGYSKLVEDGSSQTLADIQEEAVDALSEVNHKAICKNLISILESDKIDSNIADATYDKVNEQFKVEVGIANDSISNLALLDENTNRSYGNAIFPVKRNRIIDNDMKGLFVPICTKNVFLKYYSKQMKDVMYWQERDAEDYLDSIKSILKNYLPKKN